MPSTGELEISRTIEPDLETSCQLIGTKVAFPIWETVYKSLEEFKEDTSESGDWTLRIQLKYDGPTESREFCKRLSGQLAVLLRRQRPSDKVRSIGGISARIELVTSQSSVRTHSVLTAETYRGTLTSPDLENLPAKHAAYLKAASDREELIREILSEFHGKVQRSLKTLLKNPRPTFRADEQGYRDSFDLIDAIQRDVASCRSVLMRKDTPVFLRRLLPPNKSGRNQVLFAVHDYESGRQLDEPTIRIPDVNVSAETDIDDNDCHGVLEVIRQQKIEGFRRSLMELEGTTTPDKEAIKIQRTKINERRTTLSLGFYRIDDSGQPVRVNLDTSHSSFQLRTMGKNRVLMYSNTEFPQLLLLDTAFK